MMLCKFKFDLREKKWRCTVCGRVVKVECKAHCRVSIVRDPMCPLHTIVSRLAPAGVDRLQLCRAAGCGLMHVVDGHTACVGMGGGKCTWVTKWSACLNGETAFPTGAPDCPHWVNSCL